MRDDFQALAPLADDDGQGLFPAKPPGRVTAWTGALIVGLFVTVATVAVFVPFPEAVRCAFVLVPEGGADPVRAPRDGAVVQLLVSETQVVRKGQDLFVIRSQEIRGWTAELRTVQQEIAADNERLRALERDLRAELDIQTSKVRQFERDLAFQQEYVKTVRDFLSLYEQLDSEGLVSRVDVMAQRLSVSKGERDMEMTRQSRGVAALEMTRIQNEYRSRRDDVQLSRRKAEVRLATLEKLLENTEEDVVRVKAPFDGCVLALGRRNRGDVVTAGQELCRIARSDAMLMAELTPPEQGLPRLRTGQRVQLLFDAYPYERFGTGRGTVRWISPAAVTTPSGEGFVVQACLDGQTLGAPSADRPLRAGMRGEAAIVVGRRTLFDYAIEPLRKLRENVGTNP